MEGDGGCPGRSRRSRGPRRRAGRRSRSTAGGRDTRSGGDSVRVVDRRRRGARCARGSRRLLEEAGRRGRGHGRRAAEALITRGRAHAPRRRSIVDIRMPPTHTDEGIRSQPQDAAASHPEVGVLRALSLPRLALRHAPARASTPSGAGYLLKERVSDVAVLVDALHRMRRGRVRGRPDDRLAADDARRTQPARSAELTDRARREVLTLDGRGPLESRRSASSSS